jgi:hypothetical protein
MKGVKTCVPKKPRVTLSLLGSLHFNCHNSLMESQKDKPFVVV